MEHRHRNGTLETKDQYSGEDVNNKNTDDRNYDASVDGIVSTGYDVTPTGYEVTETAEEERVGSVLYAVEDVPSPPMCFLFGLQVCFTTRFEYYLTIF